MKTVLAALLSASLALGAEPPADAPLDSVHLEAGQPAPFAGRLVATAEFIVREQQAREDHEIALAVKPGSGVAILPAWSVVAIAVAGAVLGGLGVGLAVGRPWEKR